MNCGVVGKSRIKYEIKFGNFKKNRVLFNEWLCVFIFNERDINNIRKFFIMYYYKVNGDMIKKILERYIDLYFRDEIKIVNLENRVLYVFFLK